MADVQVQDGGVIVTVNEHGSVVPQTSPKIMRGDGQISPPLPLGEGTERYEATLVGLILTHVDGKTAII